MNISVGGGFGVGVSQQGGPPPVISPGDYFNISSPSTNYYVWFTYDGIVGIDQAPPGRSGLQVNVTDGDTPITIASSIAATLNSVGGGSVFAATPSGPGLTVMNLANGNSNDIADVSVGPPFTVNVFVQGSSGGAGGGGSGTTTVTAITDIDISTASAARTALDTTSTRLQTVSTAKATAGAFVSRLDLRSRFLDSFTIEMAVAESRITDVDVADEVSKQVSSRIREQVATSILAVISIQRGTISKLVYG
jgi:flagellin-like hook-associated protein FlgL